MWVPAVVAHLSMVGYLAIGRGQIQTQRVKLHTVPSKRVDLQVAIESGSLRGREIDIGLLEAITIFMKHAHKKIVSSTGQIEVTQGQTFPEAFLVDVAFLPLLLELSREIGAQL